MALIAEFEELFSEWILAVTGAIDRAAGHVLRSRRIVLNESEDGIFTATSIASKSTPVLTGLSFSLMNGRPNPPLPEEWVAAFRGSRIEVELPPQPGDGKPARFSEPGRRFPRRHGPVAGRSSDALVSQ